MDIHDRDMDMDNTEISDMITTSDMDKQSENESRKVASQNDINCNEGNLNEFGENRKTADNEDNPNAADSVPGYEVNIPIQGETEDLGDDRGNDDTTRDSVADQACFICYKNINDPFHKSHTDLPFVCLCDAFFDSMDEIINHKQSCKLHCRMMEKLKQFSCCDCQILFKTKQNFNRHIKSTRHKKRIKELSVEANQDQNGAEAERIRLSNSEEIIDVELSSEGQMAKTILSHNSDTHTRKLSPLKRGMKRFSGHSPKKDANKSTNTTIVMHSDAETEKLIEDIKISCNKLEELGKNYLLIVSDKEDCRLFGSEVAQDFVDKKNLIPEYLTFQKGRRKRSSRVRPTESKFIVAKKPKQNVPVIKEARVVVDKIKTDNLMAKRSGQALGYNTIVDISVSKEEVGSVADCFGNNTDDTMSANIPSNGDDDEEDYGVTDHSVSTGIGGQLSRSFIAKKEGETGEVRMIPVQGSPDDMGTEVDIKAAEGEQNVSASVGPKTYVVQDPEEAKALFKKWSELDLGTAKDIVKEKKSGDVKYVQTKSGVDIHICQKCGLYFMSHLHLKTHQNKIIKCDTWNYIIPQNSEDPLEMEVTLKKSFGGESDEPVVKLKHLLESNKSTPYQCQICDKKMQSFSKLKEHYKCHAKKTFYSCGICGVQVASESGLNKHLMNHFVEPFDCQNCKRRFSSLSKLENHQGTECNLEYKTYELAESTGLRDTSDITCTLCGYKAPNLSLLASHQTRHTDKKSISCVICMKLVRSQHMKRHMVLVHQATKPFKCEICDKSYKDRVGLKRHTQIHKGEKFTCPTCQKEFQAKEYLQYHMYTHNKVKRYVCQFCGSSYTKKHYFDNHVRIHTGEKPFICSLEGCEKAFRCRASLQQHIRNHEKVGQYVCDICGRTFKQPGMMNHHRRSHFDQYRWACHYCPEKFKSIWSYKRHLAQTHPEKKEEIERTTNIKLHKCALCDKIYHDLEDLRRHVNNHNGIKPHKCKFCGKTFSDRSNLKVHEDTHLGTTKLKCKRCYKSFLHEHNLLAHTKRVHPEQQVQENEPSNLTAYSSDDLDQDELIIALDEIENPERSLQNFNY